MHPELQAILAPAYPCSEMLSGACFGKMLWNPAQGHVPRGFVGATGELSEVQLVLVVAEPGPPATDEEHSGLLQSAYDYAVESFRAAKGVFHQNVRSILDLCWPGLSFDEQLRRFWLTESVLCSAESALGRVPRQVEHACGHRYLLRQLKLFPSALVVGLGGKSHQRLKQLGVRDFLRVHAVAPPAGNKPKSKETWKRIPIGLRSRFPGSS